MRAFSRNRVPPRCRAFVSPVLPYVKYFLFPCLTAVYPSFYFFGNNVHDLLLVNLWRNLLIYISLAAIIYSAFLWKYRNIPEKAANATVMFLLYFNLYGYFQNLVLKVDLIPSLDFLTLPITLLLSGYTIWAVNKLNRETARQFWKFGSLFMGWLILINILIIVPKEITKLQKSNFTFSFQTLANDNGNQTSPDIYYIILDEFSGIPPMRDYWQNDEVEDFINFLNEKGFILYENSHGSSINTPQEIATRLNFQEFSHLEGSDSQKLWFDHIANNRTMDYLRQKGYSIITFEEMQYAYPSATPINADISFNYFDATATNFGMFFDDFGMLVADNTMLKIFSPYYKKMSISKHSDMIFFTTTKIGDLSEIKGPKFVYVHLLFPHSPFIFDRSGNINPPNAFSNYNYYLGNYNFSMVLTKKMINNILADAVSSELPIIILQSDHGLRNYSEEGTFIGHLENFPEEYKTSILNALLMTGYEPSYSTQEMDPINTFPIIFNHLFDANIPLQ